MANLKTLVSSSRRTVTYNYIKNQLGSDSTDLKARSPYYAAEAITTPLLLVHGDEDRSVPVSQSRDMAEELEDNGHDDFRYIELENGDHYLSIQANRHKLFIEMERFLATYLR
ncbi:alpha/beta hydrolase family protein [Salinimonas marina]|uniref:alpha/beta hydrolase family protein n=1 Tax=Salinimonas marina TaxID=2785918 RepID=UPI001E2E48BA|nr:prolyl oligopeptidase family serine peptidase [Salinimonas marina]